MPVVEAHPPQPISSYAREITERGAGKKWATFHPLGFPVLRWNRRKPYLDKNMDNIVRCE